MIDDRVRNEDGPARTVLPALPQPLTAGLDLRLLSSFAAVAEELHFGRAAERLRIAQPALSRQIGRLEEQVGARLFERSTRRVTLTAAGEVVLAAAADILGVAERAARVVQDQRETLTVLVHAAVSPRLRHHVGQFVAAHPGLAVEVRDRDEAILPDVADGSAGVAVDLEQAMPPGLCFVPCARTPVGVACSAEHRLARQDTVTWAELAGERVGLAPEDHSPGYNLFLREHLQAAGVAVEETPGPRVNPSLLASCLGGGWTGLFIAPRHVFAPLPPDVAWIPLAPEVRFGFGVAWRADDTRESTRSFVRWMSTADRR